MRVLVSFTQECIIIVIIAIFDRSSRADDRHSTHQPAQKKRYKFRVGNLPSGFSLSMAKRQYGGGGVSGRMRKRNIDLFEMGES